MSGSCCEDKNFDGASLAYKKILCWVIFINLAMFLVEIVFSRVGRSQALQADALDFLADGLTYTLSLLVIGHSLRVRSMASLIKGVSLSVIAAWVLGSTIYRFFFIEQPEPAVMGSVALLALAANLLSVLLLMRFKEGDSNVSSVWLCSRNDAIGNVAVIIAAGAVWLTHTAWPDLIVALIMSGLFFSSSVQILRQVNQERKQTQSESRG